MFSCCTGEEALAYKGTAGVDELAMKGDDLEIEREDETPNFLKTQSDLIKYLPPDWVETAKESILTQYAPKWRGTVRNDKDVLSYKNNNIKNLVLADNAKFLGQMDSDGKRMEGIGYWLDKEGTFIMGSFERNFPHGQCFSLYANGDYFLGEFMNGQKLYGMMYMAGLRRFYDGTFQGGLPEGAGRYRFDDGREYKGEFKSGKPEGKGKFAWPNGNTYEGDFKNGKQHGIGNLHVKKSGRTFITEWKDGVMTEQ